MRTRDLINLEEAYMSVYEASYIPSTTSVGNITKLSDPKNIEAATKKYESKIEENFKILEADKDNIDVATDTFNLIVQLNADVYTIEGKTYTIEEVLKKLLEDTKAPNHDWELLTHKTILAYKKAGGSEAFYHLYKEIFRRLGIEAAPYNRRETSTRSAVIYYFGVDGEPYKTTLKVGDDNIVHGTGFWATNRPAGVSEEQWRSGNKGYKPAAFGVWKPSIDGLSIEEIREKVSHEGAANEFEKKFPPLEYPQYYTKR